MLPSKGYFNLFDCPYYLSSTNCQRPYCHFKHSRRDLKQDGSVDKISKSEEDKVFDRKELISSAPIPETPIVAPVKHIPITLIPTKPSGISVNTKKPKVVQSQYVPSAISNNETRKKVNNTLKPNPFSSFDYDPSSFIDSSEKTYSRYSYEKGHDSGDEIMENHKSIIETNNLKLDEGSKSGYDEETDDFDGEAQFSPAVSPKEEEEEACLKDMEVKLSRESKPDLSTLADIKSESSVTSTGTDETKNLPRRDKCKKKRKHSEISESDNNIDNDKKENVVDKHKEKTDKSNKINLNDFHNSSKSSSNTYDRVRSISPKLIKIEKNLDEVDTKTSNKKVCKKDKKKHKHSSEESKNLFEEKDDNAEVKKHLDDDKKHSSSTDIKRHSSERKHHDKKDEIKSSNKSLSSEQKKLILSNKKHESKNVLSESENKHKKHSSSSKKHSESKSHLNKDSTTVQEGSSTNESKKHSDSKKRSSSETKTNVDKDITMKKHTEVKILIEKDASVKNHLSKDKSNSLHKSKTSDKHLHSSGQKKHSSSDHKKRNIDNEKTSSTNNRDKKQSTKSSSSKSRSGEKKHSDESKKQSDKKNSVEKHSKHKTYDDSKKSKTKSSRDSKCEDSHKPKETLKRKHSDSSDSVISADEKKETILISDSSESGNESNRELNSPPRIEDILGLGDSNESSDSSENEDEYKPMHVGGFKTSSPAYKPSPISSMRKTEDQADAERNFIQVPTSSSDEHYTKPVTSSKVRIAHVPNVSSLLSAKTLINSGKTVSSTFQKIVTATRIINPSASAAKAVVVPSTSRPRPTVNIDLEAVVATNIRQPGLNNIFDELLKFVSYEEAYKRAVEEETEICNVATNPQSYRNRVALCILRIRKSKGALDIVKKDKINSDSIPDYTYGVTLYECFSKYLLKPEEYVLHGYPLELPGRRGCVYIDKSSFFRNKHVGPTEGPFRKCVNCSQEYAVDEETGMPLTKNDCHHHWGKPIGNRQGKFYTCCKSEVGSEPCHISMYHVTEMKNDDCLSGFVRTRPYPEDADPNKAGIFAMDCEMCYTTQGRDIVRASLLAVDNESVYDVLIKPKHPILDYCTRFSGITEEKLANVTTTLEDVQKFLLKTIFDKTILVGHSLENDLKALKMIHYNVVDTSIMYPHKEGLPVKCALRTLCSRILGQAIQTGENGHDSLEDSRASLQLVLHQVKEDAKSRKPRVVKELKSSK